MAGIFCSNLRTKLFGKPDPFLKMGVVPGPRLLRSARHAQRVVTDPCFGSVHPQWIQVWNYLLPRLLVWESFCHQLECATYVPSKPNLYINTSLKNMSSFIQSYEFGVVSTDVLEIDVRDKFVASRPSFTHFLGRARIPASQLLRRSSV